MQIRARRALVVTLVCYLISISCCNLGATVVRRKIRNHRCIMRRDHTRGSRRCGEAGARLPTRSICRPLSTIPVPPFYPRQNETDLERPRVRIFHAEIDAWKEFYPRMIEKRRNFRRNITTRNKIKDWLKKFALFRNDGLIKGEEKEKEVNKFGKTTSIALYEGIKRKPCPGIVARSINVETVDGWTSPDTSRTCSWKLLSNERNGNG